MNKRIAKKILCCKSTLCQQLEKIKKARKILKYNKYGIILVPFSENSLKLKVGKND